MNVIICKAKSIPNYKWLQGYPVLTPNGEVYLHNAYEDDTIAQVISETLCYSVGQDDKNGRRLYIGDTINDFGGGVIETDYDHPDYHKSMAFPPTKVNGDTTRLGNIIFEDGTVRIETLEMNYCYNISNGSRFCDMEYHSNVWDQVYPDKDLVR